MTSGHLSSPFRAVSWIRSALQRCQHYFKCHQLNENGFHTVSPSGSDTMARRFVRDSWHRSSRCPGSAENAKNVARLLSTWLFLLHSCLYSDRSSSCRTCGATDRENHP